MNTKSVPEAALERATRRPWLRARAAASVGAALAAVLVPKCPLCVAGYLAALGVGAGAAAAVAPLLRPALAALSAGALAALVTAAIRARRPREPRRCCDRAPRAAP